MAGHSHASNIKHRKGRSNKLKSESFLKVRRKIELAYNSSSDKEKVFSLAREHNFPKEKVNLVIEKIEKSKHHSSFVELLYRGKHEILIYLRGNLSSYGEDILGENIKTLSLEKLHPRRLQDYFSPLYSLRVDGYEDIEETIISSLPTLVIDKIIKIERKEQTGDEFEIFFSAKGALTEAVEFFTNYPGACKLEVREVFNSLLPICINSGELLSYFSLFEDGFSKLSKDIQIFTNVLNKKVGP